MRRVGLRETVRRVPVFGLGCAGGVNGLALASRLATADPGSLWLFVTVETCSISIRLDSDDPAAVVATALFGDGAAAAVVTSGVHSLARIGGSAEKLFPDTLRIMEARAGNLINGSDKIEKAARSGKVALLIHAADAGEDGNRSLDQAWRVGGGDERGVIFPLDRTILSMALGRENVVHAALTDPAAASRVQHALARWRAFNGPDQGLEGGEPALGTGSAEDILTKE